MARGGAVFTGDGPGGDPMAPGGAARALPPRIGLAVRCPVVDVALDQHRARGLRARIRGAIGGVARSGDRPGGRGCGRTVRSSAADPHGASRVAAAPHPSDSRVRGDAGRDRCDPRRHPARSGRGGVRSPLLTARARPGMPRGPAHRGADAATVLGQGEGAPAKRCTEGRGGNGVLRQDEHETGDRIPSVGNGGCCCEPGELQQQGGTFARGERAPGFGDSGIRRGDGYVRSGGDRRRCASGSAPKYP